MPDEDVTFTDLVRGEITFKAGCVPDFVMVRADGSPLYTLVNPVDDALMGITHVLRGEDLLSSTPRQIALYRALFDIGVASTCRSSATCRTSWARATRSSPSATPSPTCSCTGSAASSPKACSTTCPCWAGRLCADEDIFTVEQLVENFDVHDVLANPARFDIKKAEAINGTHIRMLDPRTSATGWCRTCSRRLRGGDPHRPRGGDPAEAAPLIQERISLLGEAPEMLAFLFKADDAIDVADDARKGLPENLTEVLDAALAALEPIDDWTAENIQAALKQALVEGLGVKPRLAFGPVRTAISGRRISPPLFESMVILGKDSSLARLRAFRG